MSEIECSKPCTTCEKGYFLILSHAKFLNLRTLKGPNLEKQILKKTGEDLGFKSKILEDQSKDNILKTLELYAKEKDHSNCKCFMLAITTHGGEPDILRASDDEPYKLSEVLEQFDKHNCPELKDKPKIVIIDACRGRLDDSESSAPGTQKSNPTEADEPAANVLIVPIEENFFVAHATHPSFAAWDNSIFIKTLSDALKNPQFRDIIEVFTFVNHKTSTKSCSIKKPQMPSFTFSLTEKFKLAKEAPQRQKEMLETYKRSYQKDVFLHTFCKEHDADVKLLEETGSALSFKVKEWQENMSIAEMKATADNDYENCSTFVCVIKTESNARDQLFDAQDETYSLFDFVRCFNGNDCKGLWGKPKIFLIQAPVRDERKGGNPQEVALSIPNTADTLIVYSEESAFLKTLCEHLKNYKDTKDLLKILLMVNKEMLEKKLQVPTVTSHLRKKVHLGMVHQTASHANQQ